MSSYFKLVQQIRTFSSKVKKNHYDVLSISPKATQADVKSAYYKLSMVYHPDKNVNNEESATKFRDISTAYEVLGNVKMRRLYDRGLFIGTTTAPDSTQEHPFYKSREMRSKPPPPSGRTPIYDFDEWSKNHYETTFARDNEIRRKRRMYHERKEETIREIKMEKMMLGLLMVVFLVYIFSPKSYDEVQYKKTPSKPD